MIKFKPGDKIKYRYCDRWYIGEITIISKTMGIKVLFDSGDLDYYYYPAEKLFLITEQDAKTHSQIPSHQ